MELKAKPDNTGIHAHIVVANTYTIVAAAYSICFLLLFYFTLQNSFLFAVHLLSLIGIILNYLYVQRTKKFETGAYVLLTIAGILMLCLFATGGWENTGIIWPFAWLPAAFFMNTGKGGRNIVLGIFSACLVLVALHFLRIITIPYSPVTLINFFCCLPGVCRTHDPVPECHH